MRHRKQGKSLGRKTGPRKALLRSLAINLITNERMITTEAKAKVLRPQIEKMITKARVEKEKQLAVRRDLLSKLDNRDAVTKLLEELAPRFKKRTGGYTRIIKLTTRQGDGAKMAQIEFTEIPEKLTKKVTKKVAKKAAKKEAATSDKSEKKAPAKKTEKKPATTAAKK